ncbi:hypothetical protein Ahia01_000327400 [Argonauta hians]
METTGKTITVTHGQDNITQLKYGEHLSQEIWHYISPLLLAVGTVGSLLSICVLLRIKIRQITSIYLLTLLSVADITGLWFGLLRVYMLQAYDYDIRHQSDLLCKLHTFLVYFVLDFSSWLLALIAIDRFLLIVYPFIARDHWNHSKATYTVLATGAFLILANGHLMNHRLLKRTCINSINGTDCTTINDGSYEIVKNFSDKNNIITHITPLLSTPVPPESVSCGAHEDLMYYHMHVFPWIDFSIFFFLPFLIMVITHIFIISKVKKSSRKMQKKRTVTSNLPTNDLISTVKVNPERAAISDIACRKENSVPSKSHKAELIIETEKESNRISKVAGVSAMLLSVLIAFGLTTSPITLFILVNRFNANIYKPYARLIWAMVNVVQYTNNASHFFLFILTGKTFRLELIRLFRCNYAFFKWKSRVIPDG